MTQEPKTVFVAPITSERGSLVKESTLPLLTFPVASRLLYFDRCLRRVSGIDGDIVECGVGWGRSMLNWIMLASQEGKNRHIWGFDSCEGFPEPSPQDASPRNVKKGEWKTDLQSIMKMLYSSEVPADFIQSHLTFVKGFFNESLAKFTGDPIAILHVDVDLYQSYLDVLERLYPKVAVGGLILFDEYMGARELEKFPGAKKAIDAFFKGREPIQKDPISDKYYAIKQDR
jgi:O-methyltransferase